MLKPVVICAQQRSGTTALQKVIEANGFYNYGEIFHDDKLNQKDSLFFFLENAYRGPFRDLFVTPDIVFDSFLKYLAAFCNNEQFVLDIKYNSWHFFDGLWHAPGDSPGMITLAGQRRIPLLHIVRRNSVAQCLSGYVATVSKKYHYQIGEELESELKETAIEVPIPACVTHVKRIESNKARYAGWLSSVDQKITLYYEDLFAENHLCKSSTRKIEEFLGVQLRNRAVPLRKTPICYPSAIGNWEELSTALVEAGWETELQELMEAPQSKT